MDKQILVPLTSSDLEQMAHVVGALEGKLEAFTDEEGDLIDGIDDVLVKILRPESDEVAGEVRWHGDGWFGFYPYRVSE